MMGFYALKQGCPNQILKVLKPILDFCPTRKTKPSSTWEAPPGQKIWLKYNPQGLDVGNPDLKG